MSNKLLHVVLLGLSLMVLSGNAEVMLAWPSDTPLPDRPLTKEEVFRLLPKGSDMQDPREQARYSEFLARGEELYPALIEIIEESDNYYVVGSALSTLRQTKGDKREVAKTIAKMIPKRLESDTQGSEYMLIFFATTLGDIGSATDVEFLYPLLNHEDIVVRLNALVAIANKGDAEALVLVKHEYESLPERYRNREFATQAMISMEARLGVSSSVVDGNLVQPVKTNSTSPVAAPEATRLAEIPEVMAVAEKPASRNPSTPWNYLLPLLALVGGMGFFAWRRRRKP